MAEGLQRRYQLIIRNVEDFSEKASPKFGYNYIIIISSILFVLLFGCSLWLSTTVLSKWLSPVYIAQENKAKLHHLANTVEKLEQETAEQANFITLLQNFIKGTDLSKQPAQQAYGNHKSGVEGVDELAEKLAIGEDNVPDRAQTTTTLVTTDNDLSLRACALTNKDIHKEFFRPPIGGHITRSFNERLKHYGVDIVAQSKSPIKSIAAGVVVFASWTIEHGWIIAIQHQDLLSIYQHCDKLLKTVGNFVESGDVIAIMGNSGELSSGAHLHLEIWHQGTAVDPTKIINF